MISWTDNFNLFYDMISLNASFYLWLHLKHKTLGICDLKKKTKHHRAHEEWLPIWDTPLEWTACPGLTPTSCCLVRTIWLKNAIFLMALISKEREDKDKEPGSLAGWGGRSGWSRWSPSTAGSRGSRRAAGSTGGPGSWGAHTASSSRCPRGWSYSGWSRAAGWSGRCCTRSSGPGSPGPRRKWSAKWKMLGAWSDLQPRWRCRDGAKVEHQVPRTYLPHVGEREQEVFAGCCVGLGGGPLYI